MKCMPSDGAENFTKSKMFGEERFIFKEMYQQICDKIYD